MPATYRVAADRSVGHLPSIPCTSSLLLPDCRAYEIVSPDLNHASLGSGARGMALPDGSGVGYYTIDSPKNKEFLAAMQKKFGSGLKTPNDLSVPQYEGVYAYKLAVEKAGSTDADKVIAALADVSFEGPRGVIKMNKQRHAPLTMYLGQVQKDGSVKMLSSFKDVDPGEQCPKLK